MLDGEGDGDQDRADEEGRVEPELETFLQEAEIEQLDLPRPDRRVGREQGVEDVARGDAAADGEHRRPGEPVAPHRERRDELGIAHPGRRAIDRGAARFVREQAGDLGIGEGLDEAEQHRQRPHQDRGRADRGGDAADREQDESGHAARDPEGIFPADDAVQFRLRRRRGYIGSLSGSNHGYPSFIRAPDCMFSSRARIYASTCLSCLAAPVSTQPIRHASRGSSVGRRATGRPRSSRIRLQVELPPTTRRPLPWH